MKQVSILLIGFSVVAAARADFSYTMTRKTTGGMMASMGGGSAPQTSKFLLKGQKMLMDTGNLKTLLDFDAQTITAIDTRQKTYTVKSFDDSVPPASVDMKIDVKETGQKKVVNGFNASELLMTMEINNPQPGPMSKMNVEMEMWLSPAVPGIQEIRSFYQRNAGRFPWSALAGGGNPAIQNALAELQKKIASMNGVQVEQVVRVKAPAGAAPAGMTPKQAEQAQAARARLEAMKAQGGMQAAMAEKALAMMGGGAAPGAAGSLIEMTMDSSDFSTGAIPDSAFAIPDDYKKQ